MHPLHNYANGADYAKWCILGGKMVQICNKLCNMVHFRWERRNVVQIMHHLHYYANSADYAKWWILGGEMVHFRWGNVANSKNKNLKFCIKLCNNYANGADYA